MISKKTRLIFLAAAFFCLFNAVAFSQVLNKAYDQDQAKQEWPIVSLAPEGNKYLAGDRLVILVELENHGRIDSLIKAKTLKLMFYLRGETDSDWRMIEPKQVKFLDFPAVLKSGETTLFARVIFDTNKLKVKGKFEIYTEVLGLNVKSSPIGLEVQIPVKNLK